MTECSPNARRRLKCSAPLVLIGGATVPTGAALAAFIELAHGREGGLIVGLTSASGSPIASARQWRRDFALAGCHNVEIPIVSSRQAAEDTRVADIIDKAAGVFMGGGDQRKLVSIVSGTPTAAAIRRAHERGAVIGGTSAGAAAMSITTLAGNEVDEHGHLVEQYIGPGFGLLPQPLVIDTHFSQRRRLYRLFVALAEYPDLMGLGIDENTALVVQGDIARVVGDGGVTFVDGRTVRHSNAGDRRDGRPLTIADMRVGIVGAGNSIDLEKRALVG